MLSRLLATTNHPLTTSPSAITAPSDLEGKTVAIIACCTESNTFKAWRRQAAADSAASTLCLEGKEPLGLSVSAGKTPFFAKTAFGTGTLEVEWWG